MEEAVVLESLEPVDQIASESVVRKKPSTAVGIRDGWQNVLPVEPEHVKGVHPPDGPRDSAPATQSSVYFDLNLADERLIAKLVVNRHTEDPSCRSSRGPCTSGIFCARVP